LKVIVGLGNPGREYANTRHNAGWWLVDHLAETWHLDGWRKDNDALVAAGVVNGTQLRLLKPQTYMNLSGDALRPYTRRAFWSGATDLLVVVDDVALPVGRYRLRAKGSAGGHNGLRHIEHTLKSNEYARLRIGVGPGENRSFNGALADFVLSPVGKMEREEIVSLFPTLTRATERWMKDGILAAMNEFNAN
jgi:PTH1 family peptidyl-tRNA hydrolase